MEKWIAGFGEVMLRLAPAGKTRFAQALPGTLEATFGGGEANVCASLAILGEKSRYLTALPENLAARCGLLPFHAVGTDGGLLLYFRPDSVLRADGTALDCVCAVSAVSIGQGAYEGLIGV